MEKHPLLPFYPDHAKWLFLGSFPPQKQHWSMDFFYPNFRNDMWRIFGLIFFKDQNHFVNIDEKCFRKDDIIAFLTKQGIAMYDTAEAVVRNKGNASDKDLEIVEATDISAIVRRLPCLQNIVATGQIAAEAVVQHFAEKEVLIPLPTVGACASVVFEGRTLRLYRMPSSSRAYPLSLEKKANLYGRMFFG